MQFKVSVTFTTEKEAEKLMYRLMGNGFDGAQIEEVADVPEVPKAPELTPEELHAKHDQELLSSIASDYIVGPHMLRDASCNHPEDFIARWSRSAGG